MEEKKQLSLYDLIKPAIYTGPYIDGGDSTEIDYELYIKPYLGWTEEEFEAFEKHKFYRKAESFGLSTHFDFPTWREDQIKNNTVKEIYTKENFEHIKDKY